MSIELKINKKINLDIPEFTCDGSLANHLEDYDMLKNLNGFKFTGLIGKPGSGKTSTLISWLSGLKSKRVFRKVFNHVLLVMPPTSRASMKKNIFEKHDTSKMYEELDLPTISSIYEKLVSASEKKESSLLILDDIGASLKNKEIQKLLRKIIYNRRHLKVHIIVLLQSYLSVPKEVRKLFNNLVLFKPSKVESENLFSELFEFKKNTSIDIIKYVFTDAHDSLFLNVDNQRMFKDFDEIIIHEND
jgi:KaiC/GvpD/RAD55 family RecA-like ATPase